MIVGGFAVNYFGRLRLTEDIDVVIAIDPPKVDALLKSLDRNKYKFHKEEIRILAKLSNRFTIADPTNTYRIDLWIPKTGFEKHAFQRRRRGKIDKSWFYFTSSEDLILFKLLAGRPQDVSDIEGILQRQKGKLDRDYLRFWAMALNKYEELKKIEEEK